MNYEEYKKRKAENEAREAERKAWIEAERKREGRPDPGYTRFGKRRSFGETAKKPKRDYPKFEGERRQPPLRNLDKVSDLYKIVQRFKQEYDLQPEWASKSLAKLMEKPSPSIYFFVVRDLFDLGIKNIFYRKAEQIVNRQNSVRRILKEGERSRNNDSEQVRSQKFFAQLVNLQKISMLGVNKFNNRVQDEVSKMMACQSEDGRFPLQYHHHARAMNLLFRMGLSGNRRLDRGLLWLAKRQHGDGGWLHRSMVPDGTNYDSHPSCIWTTMEVLTAFSARGTYKGSELMKRGIDFLLSHYLEENSTQFMKSADYWNALAEGHKEDSMFYGGTLKLMEILSANGFTRSDRPFKKMLKWLLNQKMEDGHYPAHTGKVAQAHPFVTLRVLRILKQLYHAENIANKDSEQDILKEEASIETAKTNPKAEEVPTADTGLPSTKVVTETPSSDSNEEASSKKFAAPDFVSEASIADEIEAELNAEFGEFDSDMVDGLLDDDGLD